MTTEPAAAPRALLVGADAALLELIAEWLGEQGYGVAAEGAAGPIDLVVADLPFPRGAGAALLGHLEQEHPGTPVLALSSNFLPGVEAGGAVARALGVAGVLPKPVSREALLAAVGRLLPCA